VLARLFERGTVLDPLKAKPPRAGARRSLGRVRDLASLDRVCARCRGASAFARRAERKETPMLRIYETILEALRMLRPVIAQIEWSRRSESDPVRRSETDPPETFFPYAFTPALGNGDDSVTG
jgi:hypothetical protein